MARNSIEYRILDRPRMARIVSDLVRAFENPKRRKNRGNQSAAARKTGISQATLSKLIAEKQERIGLEVVEKLLAHLSKRDAEELGSTLLTPEVAQALVPYQEWLQNELRRYDGGDNQVLLEEIAKIEQVVQREEYFLVYDLSDQRGKIGCWNVLERLTSNKRHDQHFSKFWTFVKDRLANSADAVLRMELSVCRVLRPLLAGSESGGIERTLDELSAVEVDEYLRAAFRAERILLKRESSLSRARSLVSDGGIVRGPVL